LKPIPILEPQFQPHSHPQLTTLLIIDMTSSVVIIGGSFAGILSAHAILRDILTAKVTLINTSGKFFFNIAAPRILEKPTAIKPQDYLVETTPLFGRYLPESLLSWKGKQRQSTMTNAQLQYKMDVSCLMITWS
jgi:hypothetical protein